MQMAFDYERMAFMKLFINYIAHMPAFLRSGKDFYLLDVYTDTLYQTNLELSQDESIRNAISDGNDICISIMDERDTETFTTKNTIMVDFDKLKKSISVLTS